MSEKKSFVMFTEWWELIQDLPNEEAGRLFKEIFRMQTGGKRSTLSGETKKILMVMCKQFKRDREKWEQIKIARAEAGRKSGIARSERTSVHFVQQSEAKRTVNVNGNDNVDGYVNVGSGAGRTILPAPPRGANKTNYNNGGRGGNEKAGSVERTRRALERIKASGD